MSSHQPAVSSFLVQAKSQLATAIQKCHNVTLVSGNQSADLDSMTSAILYAYLRSQAPPKDAFTPLYIPLLAVPAADVELRPEFLAIFKQAGIQTSNIITLDDLSPSSGTLESLRSENTRWILVDHNKLEGQLGAAYGDRVHGVVDHHAEEHAVPKTTTPEPRIIENCGSCTSLVVRYLAPTWDSIKASSDSVQIDAQLAKLALASIVIDTKNLTDHNKVEEVDILSAKYLVGKILREGKAWDQDVFFESIDNAKRDIEGLPLQGILRKDYKEWTEAGMVLGMSSVVKPLSFLVGKARSEPMAAHGSDKESWNAQVRDFMDHRGLDIFAIMTAFLDSKAGGDRFTRELYVQWADSPNKSSAAEAVSRFENLARADSLGLEEKGVGGIVKESRLLWRQNNVAKSRKQVGPLLRRAMRGDSWI